MTSFVRGFVPVNRRYSIGELERAAIEYRETTGRRVSIEWTMMDEVNDTVDQARLLADIARRTRAHVNLIALNPTPLNDAALSTASRIDTFVRILTELGVATTVRDTRGAGIEAAWRQLRADRPSTRVSISS